MTRRDDAAREYVRTHWGHPGTRADQSLRVADPAERYFAVLGELVAVTYETQKGKLARVEDFEHEFLRPRPLLVFSPRSRLLLIAGGSYTVTARGIEH